jgi:hypothetical protein
MRPFCDERKGLTSFTDRGSTDMSVVSMYITFAVYVLLHDILMRIYIVYTYLSEQAVALWLRHCDTNPKLRGSRPDELNEFFKFT